MLLHYLVKYLCLKIARKKYGWAILTIPRYITIPNIHDTGIAEVTILTILTILMVLRRNVMLLIKELFEVKAILSFALLTLKI